jgi:hypothetical protein
MDGGRVLPLSRLRGTKRPLILAGARGFVNKCVREAKPWRTALEARGVCRALPPASLFASGSASRRAVSVSTSACAAAMACVRAKLTASAEPPADCTMQTVLCKPVQSCRSSSPRSTLRRTCVRSRRTFTGRAARRASPAASARAVETAMVATTARAGATGGCRKTGGWRRRRVVTGGSCACTSRTSGAAGSSCRRSSATSPRRTSSCRRAPPPRSAGSGLRLLLLWGCFSLLFNLSVP